MDKADEVLRFIKDDLLNFVPFFFFKTEFESKTFTCFCRRNLSGIVAARAKSQIMQNHIQNFQKTD